MAGAGSVCRRRSSANCCCSVFKGSSESSMLVTFSSKLLIRESNVSDERTDWPTELVVGFTNAGGEILAGFFLLFSGGKNTTGVQVGRFDVLASLMSLLVVVLSKHASLGFPPFHSLRGARRSRDMMMLHPPIMLSAVAVTWCPSFWRSQLALVWPRFKPNP